MNQIDTGKFIAGCRKEKGLTQAQLAEKLNITDRAVSKWETGNPSLKDIGYVLGVQPFDCTPFYNASLDFADKTVKISTSCSLVPSSCLTAS